jgi:hypothetical protein
MTISTLTAYTGLALMLAYSILQIAIDLILNNVSRKLQARTNLQHVLENEPAVWYRRVSYYVSQLAVLPPDVVKKIKVAQALFFLSNLMLVVLLLLFIAGNVAGH